MKKLLIVESPAKAKTITKFLGKDFFVTSTMGHIKDLPEKKIGVEIDKNCNIKIDYEILKKKDKTIKEIKKAAIKAEEIYLAPDADREGEIIALHAKEVVEEVIKSKKVKIKRVTYNEISKKAIMNAIEKARDIDYKMVEAQQARRILDRLVGYKVSPILWKKISKGLSAGRVQSVALKMICQKEEEIKAFVKKEYWTVHGVFEVEKFQISADLIKINSKKVEDLLEIDAKKIEADVKKLNWYIDSIKDTDRVRKPYAPFITSTLQQAAYNVLGFNVQRTMSIAQNLYEGVSIDGSISALITYMRTDSTRLSDESIKDVRSYISKNFGDKYLPENNILYVGKAKDENVQDAHEAIRPIDVNVTPDSIKKYVEKDIYELYNLIWKRFVACQMNNAKYITRSIIFTAEKDIYNFRASGSVVVFDGFLKVYAQLEEDEEDKNNLPPMIEEGKKSKVISSSSKQHFTQPPARYSEATLVGELKEQGIGRPSTYAAILRTIRDRLYTFLDEKKRFVPTDLGILVSNILQDNLPKIMDLKFTAIMEENLDKIANGKITRNEALCDFYNEFSEAIEKFEKKKLEKSAEKTDIKCQQEGCSGMLNIKIGRTGAFLGCSLYPDCKFTSNFAKDENGKISIIEAKKDEILDINCPNCQKSLCRKRGRFGVFVACSGYPDCKYIHKEQTKNNCPLCNKNKLTKKSWRGATFWSCMSYPECKFSINGNILEKDCQKCKGHFLKIFIKESIAKCISDKCDYTEEI
jgi:DNA topoisomerase-1